MIHGENDLQPEKASRMYAEVLGRAEFQVIENSSHFPFSEQPEAFARVVAEFLGKVK